MAQPSQPTQLWAKSQALLNRGLIRPQGLALIAVLPAVEVEGHRRICNQTILKQKPWYSS